MSLNSFRRLLRVALVLGLSLFGILEVGLSPAKATSKIYIDYSFADDHTCAVLLSGNVECWGDNSSGQLGLGYRSDPILQPQLVPNVSNARSVEVARGISCAVLNDGTVKCWGGGWMHINPYDVGVSYSALAIDGLSDVTHLMLAEGNGCAYMSSGQAKCWGENMGGAVGVGYLTSWVHGPVKPTLVDWSYALPQVKGAFGTMCSVSVSADLFCWGANGSGQLGLGSRSAVAYPAQVPGLSNVVDVAVENQRTCALVTSGQVFCTGSNDRGGSLGLGFSSYSGFEMTFQPVPAVSNAIDIEGGFGDFCAQLVTKQVKCWGWNFGSTPLTIDELANLENLKFIDNRVCGVGFGGIVHCLGESRFGDSPEGLRIVTKPNGETRITDVTVTDDMIAIDFAHDIESYVASPENFEYSLDGGSSWTSKPSAQTSSPLTVTGLTYGSTYSVKLRAINAAGAGVESNAVSVKPIAPASAPTIASVRAGDGQATLTISTPSQINDSSLTGYDYSIDNGLTWSHFASVDGPFIITGLTNATVYQVKVRAVNSAGAGSASDAVDVCPSLPASAPKIRWAAVGDGQAHIEMWAPLKNGGSSIVGYEYTTDSGQTWLPVDDVKTPTSLRINGLTNGRSYLVKVRAVNSAGGGTASNPVTFTPRTLASAPTITALTGLSAKLKVELQAPDFDGGSKITRYAFSVDGGAWHSWNGGATGSPQFIKGLKRKTTYSVRLRAYTSAGWGAISEPVSATTALK